jgi:hypothetical protein
LAFVPLLVSAYQLPNVPVIEFGGGFSIGRLLIVVGLLRAARERSLVWSSRQALDVLVAFWACSAILSSFAHNSVDQNPISVRVSLVLEIAGTYLYARSYIKDCSDLLRLGKCLAIVVIPLAFLMLVEKITGRNPYAAVGAAFAEAWVREGKVRAAGPFGNAILAGTAGATAVPLLVPLFWGRDRRLCVAGIFASGTIVVSSASSGPIIALLTGLTALVLWRWRARIGTIRTGVILGLIGLSMMMKAPIWYLIARIDFVGGSTSWHRAELITQALNHLNEWWLAGTDYTRHWMPYGIQWSKYHVDITNYYLKMGVLGGLPLMASFIAILIKGFQLLGRRMRAMRIRKDPSEFMLWCLGATLFSHCVNFFTVSYFDQSYIPFWLLIGALPRLCAAPTKRFVAVGPASVVSTAKAEGTIPLSG